MDGIVLMGKNIQCVQVLFKRRTSPGSRYGLNPWHVGVIISRSDGESRVQQSVEGPVKGCITTHVLLWKTHSSYGVGYECCVASPTQGARGLLAEVSAAGGNPLTNLGPEVTFVCATRAATNWVVCTCRAFSSGLVFFGRFLGCFCRIMKQAKMCLNFFQ
jgi:hypothetical protein